MKLNDIVELTVDLPEEELSAGSVGTVVHVFGAPRLAYEVEFVDEAGRTIAMLPLEPDQVRPVRR